MMRLNVKHAGQGSPIVFLHGWGFSSVVWEPLLPQLTKQFMVHTVDLPGFGQTDLMVWDEFKKQLLAELPNQFAIVGWSLGGLVATRIALEAPERITHLVNVASSPCFLEKTSWPGVPEKNLLKFHNALQSNPKDVLEEFIALQVPRALRTKLSIEYPSVGGLQLGLDWLMQWDLRSELKTLQTPLCYLFGRLDSIIPATLMPVIQKMYPRASCTMFKKASHALFLSSSDLFLNLLTSFVGDNSSC